MSDATLRAVKKVEGRGVAVPGNDIDTDRIIPARFMKVVTFDGLEEHVFEDVRVDGDGNRLGHPFDAPEHQDASVLIVNKNFGCGSSREHAPQALNRWGIKAIIGESFAEIFFGNCVALGVPCAVATQEQISQLMELVESQPETEILVDVDNRTVSAADGTIKIAVDIPDGPRNQFLAGTWDALAVLLDADTDIRQVESALPY